MLDRDRLEELLDDGWRNDLEIFRESDQVRIFRPSPTLYLLLKVNRLSEQDLAACMALLDRVEEDALKLDRDRVLRSLREMRSPDNSGTAERLRQLSNAIQARRSARLRHRSDSRVC